jgi:hypothetical protein
MNKRPFNKIFKVEDTDIVNSLNTRCATLDIFNKLELEFDDNFIYNDERLDQFNYSLFSSDYTCLNKNEIKLFIELKQRTVNCDYYPLYLENTPDQGYVVKSHKDLENNTLLCEYSGVVTLINDTTLNDDYTMELLNNEITPEASLNVNNCKSGNLGRFFSGLNNSKSKSFNKKRQGAATEMISLNNQNHVIIVTRRRIKKDEIIYINYNEGNYLYDTSNFI